MLTIAIQAGGASSRMGKDKGLMIFNGLPLVQRLVERTAALADHCMIITNQPTDYRLFPTPKVADVLPGRGALGGLYTALSAANTDFVAVIACDMPFASAALLAYQYHLIQQEDADAVIPRVNGKYEPFHAVYRREPCLTYIKKAIDADQWKAISWIDQVRVREVSTEEVRTFDSHGITFTNVNTPTEFKIAESLDRSLPQ